MLEGAGDPIAAVDRGLVIIAANPAWIVAFERLSGATFRIGMRLADDDVPVPGERETNIAFWRRALAGERFTVERELGKAVSLREEDEVTYSPVLDEKGAVVGAMQVVRDLAGRRRREAGEVESRRLESVGRLAGGIAHDFNNLMTAVLGYSELIRATLAPGDERAQDLAEIERAALRAGELTQQVLVINARDAMPDGGHLLIETSDHERDGIEGVRLRVRDTGLGMTPAVKARIFEPFFTTKAVGAGTGLGSATVHGIATQAGGSIEVTSAPGDGTTFDMFFGATNEERSTAR